MEVDLNGDGTIDFQEFLQMMKKKSSEADQMQVLGSRLFDQMQVRQSRLFDQLQVRRSRIFKQDAGQKKSTF